HIVAADPARPITNLVWQGDSRHVLFLQDKGGNENFHLFQVPISGGEAKDLTPDPKVRAEILDVDPRLPDSALITLNQRDPRFLDVYRLDLRTGRLQLDTENPGDVSNWLADNA